MIELSELTDFNPFKVVICLLAEIRSLYLTLTSIDIRGASMSALTIP